MCEKYDKEIVVDLLRQIAETLERTRRSFSSVSQPELIGPDLWGYVT